MNPIEKQNEINLQSRPWHMRLTSALTAIRRGIVWWFTGNEKGSYQPWDRQLHLERCWDLPAWEGKKRDCGEKRF